MLWLLQLFSERCDRPYNGLTAEQTAVYVVSGGRLDCPCYSDDEVYAVMRSCWRHRAERRPSAAAVHRRLAALRSTTVAPQCRSSSATPPLPPLRPSYSHPLTSSLLSPRLNNSSRPPSLSDLRSARTDDMTSTTDVITRSAALRIRDSFRKFVTSRKSRAPRMTSLASPPTSPTERLSDN